MIRISDNSGYIYVLIRGRNPQKIQGQWIIDSFDSISGKIGLNKKIHIFFYFFVVFFSLFFYTFRQTNFSFFSPKFTVFFSKSSFFFKIFIFFSKIVLFPKIFIYFFPNFHYFYFMFIVSSHSDFFSPIAFFLLNFGNFYLF